MNEQDIRASVQQAYFSPDRSGKSRAVSRGMAEDKERPLCAGEPSRAFDDPVELAERAFCRIENADVPDGERSALCGDRQHSRV